MLWDAGKEHLGIGWDFRDISRKNQRKRKEGTMVVSGGESMVKYRDKETEGMSCVSAGCWLMHLSGHTLSGPVWPPVPDGTVRPAFLLKSMSHTSPA